MMIGRIIKLTLPVIFLVLCFGVSPAQKKDNAQEALVDLDRKSVV